MTTITIDGSATDPLRQSLLSIIREASNVPALVRPPIVSLYDLRLTQLGLSETRIRKYSAADLIDANRRIDALAKEPLRPGVSHEVDQEFIKYRPEILTLLFDRKRLIVDAMLTSGTSFSDHSAPRHQRRRAQNQLIHTVGIRIISWRELLEKESVATIVGAYLLVLLSGVIVISMFTKTQLTEIVTSSFLLVLGYFFGHGVSSRVHRKNRY
jgi:hypothetical protein